MNQATTIVYSYLCASSGAHRRSEPSTNSGVALASTYILLIGSDTQYKTTYVKWEAQVAIERKCRIIASSIRTRAPPTSPTPTRCSYRSLLTLFNGLS